MRPKLFHALLVVVIGALLAGCPGPGPGGDDDDDASPTPTVDDLTQSSKNNVRFKRSERLRNDYAVGLQLGLNEVCLELGLYSCTDLVHTVALGGLAPYNLGITRPPEVTAANAPMVVDRVALFACEERTSRDFASPGTALIFGDVAGGVTGADDPAVEEAIHELYRRAVQRDARDNEIQTLEQLYTDVAATSSNPERDWAIASCFAVFTTVEALFY